MTANPSGAPERTLDQCANRGSGFALAPLLVVQQVQVLGRQVVAGNDHVRLSSRDCIAKRRQSLQASVTINSAYRIGVG